MAAFLVRQSLSRGDLRLYLSNRNGYAQDASSVRWTVYSKDGTQVSGRSLPAVRRSCGEYYAPWQTDVPNGNYRIAWEIQEEFGGPAIERSENFFVVDPSSYLPQGPLNAAAVPAPRLGTYLTGTMLQRGDLPLFLKDADGLPQDAYAVFWTVLDVAGRAMTDRTGAAHAALGEYFAQWQVALPSGDYEVLWEYQEAPDAPMQSARMRFSVILPAQPFTVFVTGACTNQPIFECVAITSSVIIPRMLMPVCEPAPCGGGTIIINCPPNATSYVPSVPVPSSGSCCAFEIPRAVHLGTGVLPPAGGYTNQAFYVIPQGVRRVTFYITYSRGAAGGSARLRLMWGNGTEETQETLVDTDITINNQTSSQSMFLQELDGPVPPDSSPVSFMLETSVPGGARTVRLIASEGGVPGSPGTIGITLTAATT